MKKQIIAFSTIVLFISSCATLQSIVKSTFPYTATLIVPANQSTGKSYSATSSASSLDQIFTGSNSNTDQISQVRISSAKIESVNPSNQKLGVFKSIRIYLLNGNTEVMVASRSDIASTAGNSLVLDIDNSRFLDSYLKNGPVRIRVDYILQNNLSVDLSIKASLGFNTTPSTSK